MVHSKIIFYLLHGGGTQPVTVSRCLSSKLWAPAELDLPACTAPPQKTQKTEQGSPYLDDQLT